MAKTVVQIEHASVRYNLALQKNHGLKDYLRALTRRELLFQEFMALMDVNHTVMQGESWGFVGKNGAGFDPELTGRENIMMNGLILGMSEKSIRSRFDEIVSFAEIEPFLDVPIKNYSSGMKSRLGFAVATCARADILIADEVLATGDKAFQAKCEARMQSLLENGTTLLFVSHSIAAVQRLCSKALWLDQGDTRMMGDAEGVLAAYDQYMIAKSKA